MQDLATRLTTLRRPRLLSRAARIGADEYVRSRHLKQVLGRSHPQRPALILTRLLDLESEQDAARRTGNPGYSFVRHVGVLIAIAAESRMYLQDIARV